MKQAPKTVLIAEDDPVFRRVLGFSISRVGLTVECVSDGEAAYKRLLDGGIDFLVTDHQMPICSGIELLEKLRQNQSIVSPPTVLCTAKGLELDSQAIESRYKLIAVVHKPFSPRKLSDLILGHPQTDPSITSRMPSLDTPAPAPGIGATEAPGDA